MNNRKQPFSFPKFTPSENFFEPKQIFLLFHSCQNESKYNKSQNIRPSVPILSQQPNESLNGKLTCDWLIQSKRKLHFGFQKPWKNSTFDEEIWRYGSTLASLKIFGRCLSSLGGQLMKRHTLGLGQNETKTTLGRWVSILVKISTNRSTSYLHVSNELWKWEFSKIGLG